MKNKKVFALIASLILFLPKQAYSDNKPQISSATIEFPAKSGTGSDYRVKILEKYFREENSPLEPYAKDFVTSADRYNLDWRLVAAIAGVESTFGKRIPSYSYNAWGWGIYGTNVKRFNSWEDGISTVSQGIKERYMDQWGGTNIYEIGAHYAASPVWANHVQLHMNRINAFALSNPKEYLSLSL